MDRHPLFYRTRLRLAAWYALAMGCILALSGLGVYNVVARAYRETIDQGLESVTDALDNSIETVWQKPGHVQELAREFSLELCGTQVNCSTKTAVTNNPLTKVTDPVNYYLRLLDRFGKPIALAGRRLEKLPLTSPTPHWQTLTDRSGIRYRQITLPLHTQNQVSGYMQVGRSLNDLDQHLAALRITLLLGWPISMILIGISSWWLAGLAMQPIYRSYYQMQQFTADAAHEFRTPLAAMRSTIDAALKLYGKSNTLPSFELVSGILPVLKRQNTRLSQLVADLLLLARIDQQQQTGKYHLCCLNDLVSDLVEELAFLAVESQIALLMQVYGQEKLYVLGNEEQLYRLVSNLIVNAIQATPSGGKVTVVVESDAQDAFIRVQDTGIGIAPEHQVHIFNRFYRINGDRSRASGGSGLGLAIAQAITTAHRGSIHVQSQQGLGSTFTVQLPLKR